MVPAGDFANRSRAAPGITHAGTMTGAGGAVPGLGQAKTGNARQFDELACDCSKTGFSGSHVSPRPRKHGLELSQPAYGVLARTAVERRKASGPDGPPSCLAGHGEVLRLSALRPLLLVALEWLS